MTETSVYRTGSSEQYMTTIPKAIAESIDLQPGDKIKWKIVSKSRDENAPDVLEVQIGNGGGCNETK